MTVSKKLAPSSFKLASVSRKSLVRVLARVMSIAALSPQTLTVFHALRMSSGVGEAVMMQRSDLPMIVRVRVVKLGAVSMMVRPSSVRFPICASLATKTGNGSPSLERLAVSAQSSALCCGSASIRRMSRSGLAEWAAQARYMLLVVFAVPPLDEMRLMITCNTVSQY